MLSDSEDRIPVLLWEKLYEEDELRIRREQQVNVVHVFSFLRSEKNIMHKWLFTVIIIIAGITALY